MKTNNNDPMERCDQKEFDKITVENDEIFNSLFDYIALRTKGSGYIIDVLKQSNLKPKDVLEVLFAKRDFFDGQSIIDLLGQGEYESAEIAMNQSLGK